ncbi:MAG: hypothetical protein ABIU87_03325 [Ornithinibacter sp.]
MGLSDWLAARAVRATRVLLVECPGTWVWRVATERAVGQRGWRLAQSPATADVLAVVGRPTGELAEVVDRLWNAMPGPRVRVDIRSESHVPSALEDAARHLMDSRAQAEDAATRADPNPSAEEVHGGMDHEGMDHEGMDHGDMQMAPDGIPLAEGSEEDRDGLEMDALPVRLGPVLPHWPAGLVLDLMLHGDLVVDATATVVGSGVADGVGGDEVMPARACDDVAALLDLAGWADGASSARAARNALLDRRDGPAAGALTDLRRGITASRLLRWSLRGVATITDEEVLELGLPRTLAGDCLDRLRALLDLAEGAGSAPVPVSALGPLVIGHDLAVARLLVASLGSGVTTARVSPRA